MTSRLDEYRQMLGQLKSAGYSFMGVEQFAKQLASKGKLSGPTVILRHDIDTDIRTAHKMFQIENQLDIRSSYYFRLSTLDFNLMKKIANAGNEVSYHFEEIASVCKILGLRSRKEVVAHMPEIQRLFRENLRKLRRDTGLPMTTVASHGDFVNRIIGMPNYELLDATLRAELDIAYEVYDSVLQEAVTVRIADRIPPQKWYPVTPEEAASRNSQVIFMLIHPKQWYANLWSNLSELFIRVGEGISYRIRARA